MAEIVSIDTNVLVRFLVEDDVGQLEAATRLFEKHTCYIPETVFLETEWVLRAAYHFESDTILRAFRALLMLESVVCSVRSSMIRALNLYEQGFDFADALHLVCSEGYPLKTFDRRFCRLALEAGYEVSEP